MEVAKPIFLNPSLIVQSYNGGSQDGNTRYGVENALNPKANAPHCTAKGTNFDLILKSKDGEVITLTNLVVKKPRNCTCPIKSGTVKVFENEPTEEELSKYKDYKEDSTVDPKPDAYFVLPENGTYVQLKLDSWKSGKYVHVKFIEPYNLYNEDPCNIDVGFVGLVGFLGTEKPAPYDVGVISDELGITPPTLKKFNVVDVEFIQQIQSRTCFYLFSPKSNADLKIIFKEFAEGNHFKDEDFLFFWGDNDLSAKIVSSVGFEEDKDIAAVVNLQTGVNYILEGSITAESLLNFGKAVLAGTANKFIKSEPRPPNDRDPKHTNLYQITTNSFEELVLKGEKEFFVDIWAPWCGPCVAVGPTIVLLADTLADVPTIGVGKMNCDDNTVDKKYFPENGIPNMKFFSASDKEKPVKYSGDRSLKSFIEFIHQNATHKFDLDKKLELADLYTKVDKSRTLVNSTLTKISKDVEKNKASLQEDDLKQIEVYKKKLEDELAKGTNIKHEDVEAVVNLWNDSDVHKKIIKLENKNVIKVHSHAEYLQHIEKAKADGKLLLVDFFATWCGPCVYIAPFLANWSEEFLDVVFLKVDVDELSETSEAVGIQCMPTFKFYKAGEIVHSIEGASKDEIYNKIKELKN